MVSSDNNKIIALKNQIISKINGLVSAHNSSSSAHSSLFNGKENTSNKVTSWTATVTDTNYPSEKLVKDSLDGKANSVHTHDDRYYTKSEVNTALNNIDEITSIVLVPKATNSDGKIIFYTGDEPS